MPPEGQVPADGNDGLDPSANPQAGQAKPTDKPAETPQVGDDAKELSEKKKLRDEAAAYRTKLRDTESELQKLRDSLKTEDERKSERLKQLELAEATWRDRERASNKKVAIALAVAKADTTDPDVLTLLLNQRELDIDDETGEPNADGLSAAIGAILLSKPYLTKAAPQTTPAAEAPKSTSAGAGTNLPRKGTSPLTRDAINSMSNEDINRMWNEGTLAEALKGGGLNKRG